MYIRHYNKGLEGRRRHDDYFYTLLRDLILV